MKRQVFTPETIWNILLLLSVIFVSFILPLLPPGPQGALFRLVYTVIYFSALFSMKKRSYYIIGLFLFTLLVEWISGLFDLDIIRIISKGVNIIFFLIVVIMLIKQIATSRNVTPAVILGSLAGYLLLGLIYSIFVNIILVVDPGAFNVLLPNSSNNNEMMNTSIPLYYSYVTLATVGYGDIVPLKPYTRSLATWIAITGQFYIAIIVALLVGKFASQQNSGEDVTNPH
jgi:voltage-gated potassium channel